MSGLIDTERVSEGYRQRAVDLDERRILMTNFSGTDQEKDFSEPANCNGFGRIRHFHSKTADGWPANHLPIKPAARALGIPDAKDINAQVFQNAVCNWRCWYCYVPFSLLAGDPKYSRWLGASDLIQMYLQEDYRAPVIDLSGGQPDLVPEWVPWMMEELQRKDLADTTYLWSDDNLSNDYFWRYLDGSDIDLIESYENYGKVCCFKGFDAESFSFNTQAEQDLFSRQFDLMDRLLDLDINIYGYVTLTTPNPDGIPEKMAGFVDRLQRLDRFLPLRITPLEIRMFTPVSPRVDAPKEDSIGHQQEAVAEWRRQLRDRFTPDLLEADICEVRLERS